MEIAGSLLSVIDGALPHLLPDGPPRGRDPPPHLPQRLHLGGPVQLVAPRCLVAAAGEQRPRDLDGSGGEIPVDVLEPPHAARRRALDRLERRPAPPVV